MALLSSSALFSQEHQGAFHTVTWQSRHRIIQPIDENDVTDMTNDSSGIYTADSTQSTEWGLSNLSEQQLERLIVLYENYLHEKRERRTLRENNNGQILSYYNEIGHELTLSNLKAVVEEVGLSNQLFVLAQAVLETGNFTSPVCKNYHNLFGLYDSRHKDYYRFARWEDSVVGYQKFIQYRYKGGDYLLFLRRIGYAEDPRYTSKVAQIATQLYKRLFTQ